MPEYDEMINPEEFSMQELVKMIYRDQKKFLGDFETFTKEQRKVDNDQDGRIEHLEDWEKDTKAKKGFAVGLGQAIAWIITLIASSILVAKEFL